MITREYYREKKKRKEIQRAYTCTITQQELSIAHVKSKCHWLLSDAIELLLFNHSFASENIHLKLKTKKN